MLSCYYVLVKITALSCRMEGGYFNMYNITSNAKIFWTNIKNNIILKYSFIHIIPHFLYSEMLLHYFISNNTFPYTKSRTTTSLFSLLLAYYYTLFFIFLQYIIKEPTPFLLCAGSLSLTFFHNGVNIMVQGSQPERFPLSIYLKK